MNRISIGAALGEGFSLMRRRPLAVLAWGAVQAVFAGLAWTLYLPFYLTMLGRMSTLGRAGAAAAPDPAMMSQMVQMQGFSMLLSLGSAVVSIVAYCAVFRAVLFPEQRRFAYMRVGAAELLLLVAGVAAYIGLLVAVMVVVFPTAIVVGVLAATHQVAIGVIIALLVGLAAVIALIYVGLRLSLLGPMTVRDGALRLTESWALTKGHVGALFAIMISQIAILFMAEVVLVLLLLLIAGVALGLSPGGLASLQQFTSRPPQELARTIIPGLMVLAVLFIPISGALIAFMGAPWARVLRDVTHSDALDAFA